MMVLAAAAASVPARAELAVGAPAPEFQAPAALAGNLFTYDLNKALSKGPVVMFFIPHAFTGQCDYEGHNFADRIREFQRYGASVIAVSKDAPHIEQRWSRMVCADKFPVVSDSSLSITRAYDNVARINSSLRVAGRTTYVILPTHAIGFVYASIAPTEHVEQSLIALARLTAKPAR
jgi:peroxiredoxin